MKLIKINNLNRNRVLDDIQISRMTNLNQNSGNKHVFNLISFPDGITSDILKK